MPRKGATRPGAGRASVAQPAEAVEEGLPERIGAHRNGELGQCRKGPANRNKRGQAMATILIAGSGGQLGVELMRAVCPSGLRAVGLPHSACDIADDRAVARVVDEIRPAVIVNAAAYTAVDRAETEPEAAFRANRDGPAILGAVCARRGIPVIHVSTDYVFDGANPGGYHEGDAVAPLGVYGRSKLDGEAALSAAWSDHVILRTAWVFGAQGQNFVKTMLRLSRERDSLRVVDDQRGCPTPADSLAAAIIAIAASIVTGRGRWGLYHFAGDEPVTWHGFAAVIFERLAHRTGKAPALMPISTADYPTPARRPANSILHCTRIAHDYGLAPPSWQAGLDRVLDELLVP
jgi:dTDP-4-dehydrorhamnose reductase